MTKMPDLPKDLVEDILSRIPSVSLKKVRCTCKKWNTLSNDECFTKKHLAQVASTKKEEEEFLAIMKINHILYLMSFNLHGIYNESEPSVKPIGKIITMDDSDQVIISKAYYCEGLVLCTTVDSGRLVIWNPYSGKSRWIPRSATHKGFSYAHALGYEKRESCRAYKVLRLGNTRVNGHVHEIYELNYNTWRILHVTPGRCIIYHRSGLSLKGNMYWYAADMDLREDVPDFLLCFDFTTESFGSRLPLPFSTHKDSVTLSSVGEEQLAVLFMRRYYEMEIWVTTKIEPNAVSWSKFLVVDLRLKTGYDLDTKGNFLIDKERKAVVIFDRRNYIRPPFFAP